LERVLLDPSGMMLDPSHLLLDSNGVLPRSNLKLNARRLLPADDWSYPVGEKGKKQ
jgi:hypothetical protein